VRSRHPLIRRKLFLSFFIKRFKRQNGRRQARLNRSTKKFIGYAAAVKHLWHPMQECEVVRSGFSAKSCGKSGSTSRAISPVFVSWRHHAALGASNHPTGGSTIWTLVPRMGKYFCVSRLSSRNVISHSILHLVSNNRKLLSMEQMTLYRKEKGRRSIFNRFQSHWSFSHNLPTNISRLFGKSARFASKTLDT